MRILAGAKHNAVNAVLVPLAYINAVTVSFVDSPGNEDTVAFMQFLNEIFVEVEVLRKQLTTVEDGWKEYAPNDEPWSTIGNWDNRLKQLYKEVAMLNTRTEWIDKAKIYNAAEQSDWNVDVMTAKSFMDITARGLERQFEDAIMKPYNEMLGDSMNSMKGYRHIGCFRDDESRTIDYLVSGGDKTIAECHAACPQHQYFALQYGRGTGKGECRCGNSRDEATRLGVVDWCDNTGTGGSWANDLYENLDRSLTLPKIDVDPLEP